MWEIQQKKLGKLNFYQVLTDNHLDFFQLNRLNNSHKYFFLVY